MEKLPLPPLTPLRHAILCVIRDNGPWTTGPDLLKLFKARHGGGRTQSVRGTVYTLEDLDLLDVAWADGRTVKYRLTPRGKSRIHATTAFYAALAGR